MTRARQHTCSSTATSHARARTWAGCCAASERYSRSARAGAALHVNTSHCVLAAAATAPRMRVGGCNLTMHASQAATPLCCTQARPPGRGHEALAERPPCGRAAHVARVLERYGTRRAPVTRRARGCNPMYPGCDPMLPRSSTSLPPPRATVRERSCCSDGAAPRRAAPRFARRRRARVRAAGCRRCLPPPPCLTSHRG